MSLRTYNWISFGAHMVLGIFFSVYFSIVNKNNPQNQQQKEEMALQDHKLTLTNVQNNITVGWSSVSSLKPTLTTVQGLLVAFFFITALFHFIYATSSLYPELITKRNNWLRWIEYSITSTIMLYIIALLCTVKDTNTYILLGSCNVIMISLGQLIEEKINMGQSPWIPMAASFFLLFSEFSVITRDFSRRINDVNSYIQSSPSSRLGIGKIPTWIIYMLVILFLFFSCFGIVSLYYSIYPDTSYEMVEKAYIILSLIAKTTLGGFLAYGTAFGQQKFN